MCILKLFQLSYSQTPQKEVFGPQDYSLAQRSRNLIVDPVKRAGISFHFQVLWSLKTQNRVWISSELLALIFRFRLNNAFSPLTFQLF